MAKYMEQISQQQTNQESAQNAHASMWSVTTYKKPGEVPQRVWYLRPNRADKSTTSFIEKR
jgi:hypothetical protein